MHVTLEWHVAPTTAANKCATSYQHAVCNRTAIMKLRPNGKDANVPVHGLAQSGYSTNQRIDAIDTRLSAQHWPNSGVPMGAGQITATAQVAAPAAGTLAKVSDVTVQARLVTAGLTLRLLPCAT